jgi:hypothetical protein
MPEAVGLESVTPTPVLSKVYGCAIFTSCGSAPCDRQIPGIHPTWLPSFILRLASSTSPPPETEQVFGVEVRNFLFIAHGDGHLINLLPSGFHVAVRIVCGEDNAVDTNRVHHAQIGMVYQTPDHTRRARLLAYIATSEDPTP